MYPHSGHDNLEKRRRMPQNMRGPLFFAQPQLSRIECLKCALWCPLFTSEQRRENISALFTAGQPALLLNDEER